MKYFSPRIRIARQCGQAALSQRRGGEPKRSLITRTQFPLPKTLFDNFCAHTHTHTTPSATRAQAQITGCAWSHSERSPSPRLLFNQESHAARRRWPTHSDTAQHTSITARCTTTAIFCNVVETGLSHGTQRRDARVRTRDSREGVRHARARETRSKSLGSKLAQFRIQRRVSRPGGWRWQRGLRGRWKSFASVVDRRGHEMRLQDGGKGNRCSLTLAAPHRVTSSTRWIGMSASLNVERVGAAAAVTTRARANASMAAVMLGLVGVVRSEGTALADQPRRALLGDGNTPHFQSGKRPDG